MRTRFCKRRHQTASGRGFAAPDVRAGRSKNFGQKDREADEVYPLAPMLTERALESGVILEAPDGT
jgi:hypothetical protein